MELFSAIQVKPISVDKAGWQIVLSIENFGKEEIVLDKIYVNGESIAEMGLIHGDK